MAKGMKQIVVVLFVLRYLLTLLARKWFAAASASASKTRFLNMHSSESSADMEAQVQTRSSKKADENEEKRSNESQDFALERIGENGITPCFEKEAITDQASTGLNATQALNTGTREAISFGMSKTLAAKEGKAASNYSSKGKNKVTVPRPFIFETEKRMSSPRERRGDAQPVRPAITKSSSFNQSLRPYGASGVTSPGNATTTPAKPTQSRLTRSQSLRLEGHAEMKTLGSGSISKDKADTSNQPEVGVKMTDGAQSRRRDRESIPRLCLMTKEKLEMETGQMRKFKALPLPRFYRENSPEKPEPVKTATTKLMSSRLGQQSSSVSTPRKKEAGGGSTGTRPRGNGSDGREVVIGDVKPLTQHLKVML